MFKKYSSIENSYRVEFLDRIKSHGYWEDEFVVQEKAHGANLSFWTTNGRDFAAAKRSGNIPAGESFYNCGNILQELTPSLSRIWESLLETRPDMSQMTIYGELIGGSYPHPEVKRDNQASKVQKGVCYSPYNTFYAFDILLDGQSYLTVDEANTLFEKAGLLYAKTLFRGSITDCLNYPNAFDSTIPSLLGLPKISPNICEGVVIRPVRPCYFNNGSRIILKNKNEKWAENAKVPKRIKKEVEVPEKIRLLREAIAGYATENRLNNVISKIGEVSIKDFGKVMGLFNQDIVHDFSKDYQETLATLEKNELKMITKSISKSTATMVRKACQR